MQNSSSSSTRKKRPRPYVKKACLHCHNSHLSCANERPCTRCVSKGIQCVERPGEEEIVEIHKNRRTDNYSFSSSSTSYNNYNHQSSTSCASLQHQQQQQQVVVSPPSFEQLHQQLQAVTTTSSSSSAPVSNNVAAALPPAAPATAEAEESSLSIHLLQIIVNNASNFYKPSPSSSPPALPPSPPNTTLSLSITPPAIALAPTSFSHSQPTNSNLYNVSHNLEICTASTSGCRTPSPTSFLQLPNSPTEAFLQSLPTLPLLEEGDELAAYQETNAAAAAAVVPQASKIPDNEYLATIPSYCLRMMDMAHAQLSVWKRSNFQLLYANASFLKHCKLTQADIGTECFFEVSKKRKNKHVFVAVLKTLFNTVVLPSESGKEPFVKKFWFKVFANEGDCTKTMYLSVTVEKDIFFVERSKQHVGKLKKKHYGPAACTSMELPSWVASPLKEGVIIDEFQVNDLEVQRGVSKLSETVPMQRVMNLVMYIETQRSLAKMQAEQQQQLQPQVTTV